MLFSRLLVRPNSLFVEYFNLTKLEKLLSTLKMKKAVLISLLCSWTIFSFGQTGYKILVATDFDGQVVQGSIDTLIQEIRKGKPVRVGWQLDFDKDKQADFDHWVPATYITILNGHVFTQIDPIFIQGPNPKIPQVEIYASSDQWSAILGTNGKLLNRFIMANPPKISAEQKEQMDASMKAQIENMTKVQTWQVATFWSVLE